MPREASVVKRVKTLLEERGAWLVKYHGGRWGRAGVPDILACYRGRFLAVECKQPGNEAGVTPLQEVEMKRIRRAGGLVTVASSTEPVEALLDQVDTTFRQMSPASTTA